MGKLVALLAGGVLLLALLWSLVQGGARSEAVVPAPSAAHEATPTSSVTLDGSASREPDADETARAAIEPEPVASEPAPSDQAPSVPVTDREPGGAYLRTTCRLELTFKLPDKRDVFLGNVELRFTDESGDERTFVKHERSDGLKVRLPRRTWRLEASADGHRHAPETLELDRPCDARWRRNVTFWPEGWVQVIVRTSDGRSFEALAEEAGVEPFRYFDKAFSVRVSQSSFTDDGQAAPETRRLATVRPPPGYRVTSIGDDVIASLELAVEPPLWVGLSMHGRFHAQEILHSGQESLVFTLDAHELERSFASLRLRAVDRDTSAPVDEAVVTLKAKHSAYRRLDQNKQATDADGRIVFPRVVPGPYELLVARGSNLVQRKVELVAGEDLDLGDIPIGTGPGIRLRTVDADGRPVQCIVELAPYRRGGHVKELYHPSLWRKTTPDGLYELPVPDVPSIVRCRRYSRYEQRGVGTPNVLIDPEAPPAELELTVHDTARIRFDPQTAWGPDHQLVIEDALGLILATDMGPGKSLRIAPGRYIVRHMDGEQELGSLAVDTPARDATLPGP